MRYERPIDEQLSQDGCVKGRLGSDTGAAAGTPASGPCLHLHATHADTQQEVSASGTYFGDTLGGSPLTVMLCPGHDA